MMMVLLVLVLDVVVVVFRLGGVLVLASLVRGGCCRRLRGGCPPSWAGCGR